MVYTKTGDACTLQNASTHDVLPLQDARQPDASVETTKCEICLPVGGTGTIAEASESVKDKSRSRSPRRITAPAANGICEDANNAESVTQTPKSARSSSGGEGREHIDSSRHSRLLSLCSCCGEVP